MKHQNTIDFNSLHNELKFSTSRSGGSGGQHVNKVETKVTLTWKIQKSKVLSDKEKILILIRLKNKINKKGQLVLSHQTDRSQVKNKIKLLAKFNELILKALKTKKKRKRTRRPAGVKAKITANKKRRSDLKQSRKKIRF
ncbi:MAG: peptide chain release factor-like protein [Saprospiraceae bacterium]